MVMQIMYGGPGDAFRSEESFDSDLNSISEMEEAEGEGGLR
jgi:hypothetical protein